MEIGRYIFRRVLLMIPQFIGMTILVFIILRLAPGSPVDYYLSTNPYATQEYISALEERMGLNLPAWKQYFYWFGNLAKGDLGESLSNPGKPVLDVLKDKIVNSLILSLGANILSLLIAIPVGVISAVERGKFADGFFRIFALFGYSMPSFWLALVLIQIFAVQLGWLPAVGFVTISPDSPFIDKFVDGMQHAIMPMIVLGLLGAALTSRMVRSSMLEILGEDYIRTAHSKGLAKRDVIYRHALKNALLPVVTIVGVQVGFLFASAAVTETVFAWPGIGREVVIATMHRDYPVVQGVTVIVGTALIAINLLTDIVYAFLDPRIRFQ